jgi:hypothetical protein
MKTLTTLNFKIEKIISKKEILEVKITTENNYFAITGTTYEKFLKGQKYRDYKEFNGEKFEFSTVGCIHETILKYFPEFKIFIDLHLSNLDGLPMYFDANGFYYITQFLKRKDYSLKTIQNHFRVDRNEAKKLCRLFASEGEIYAKKYVLNNYINRYKKESKNALKELKKLI